MVQFMSFTEDEILEMKKALTLYAATKNFYIDSLDMIEDQYTHSNYKRVISPVIEMMDRQVNELVPETKTGEVPDAHAELLLKLIHNSMKIQLANAKWKAQIATAGDVIHEADDAVLDVMPDLLDYRSAQMRKGKTVKELKARKLTTGLGIRLSRFD